jgi:hypothetical protein
VLDIEQLLSGGRRPLPAATNLATADLMISALAGGVAGSDAGSPPAAPATSNV